MGGRGVNRISRSSGKHNVITKWHRRKYGMVRASAVALGQNNEKNVFRC